MKIAFTSGQLVNTGIWSRRESVVREETPPLSRDECKTLSGA